MKPIKYIIEKVERYDDCGERNRTFFCIKHLKTFLFFTYWKYETERVAHYGGTSVYKRYFSSQKDAEFFITSVLCSGKKRNTTERTIVSEISCS